ncbi:MAG: glycosyltransferase, partial [Candidatus Fonsibacter sp.]
MDKVKSLSVIIPLFKDHKTVNIVYKKFRKIIRKIKIKSEIIFIDDACPFKSGQVLLPYKKHDKSLKVIFHKKNKGYGATLKTGLV